MSDWKEKWAETRRCLFQEGPTTSFRRDWTPVGTVITVYCSSMAELKLVDEWLEQRGGTQGVDWNKARMISVIMGGSGNCWQEYSVVDPNVAFELKMTWGGKE